MMDNLLREFHLSDELHANAIQHSLDKKAKLNDVNVFYQPETWDILSDMIENGNYFPNIAEQNYRDKLTGNVLSYQQAMEYKKNGKKVRELNVLPFMDRVIFNCFYKICYDRFEYLIHPRCVSYRKGIGTSVIARDLSSELAKRDKYFVIKSDLSKFFDTVPIEIIDKTLDMLSNIEPSMIWKPIRDCYHDNRLIVNGECVEFYQSLKQGNAFAALLANIILRDIDEEISTMDGIVYYRYSDDVLILCEDERKLYKAFFRFQEMLNEKGLTLNRDKTEQCNETQWFEFLGFSFKGSKVSVSSKTLRNLKIKIKETTMSRTRKAHKPASDKEIRKAIRDLQRYFFTAFYENQENFGMGVYLFGTVNVEHDLRAIENYIKDCLRAMATNHSNIYSLGYVNRENYVIDDKNIGQNVTSNNLKTKKGSEDDLLRKCGWISLMKMFNDYHTNADLFENSVYRMAKGL